MKIAFLGAARTVTGSQHLVSINGYKILLDCGLYQGRQPEAYERNHQFDFDPGEIEAVILSHAHIDHSGNLPGLIKSGYQGPIYATHVTTHLAEVMLRDSGHIQEEDAAFANQKRAGRGEPPVEPLYTQAEAALVAERFKRLDYKTPFEPAPGVMARLVEAGHILGSAAVVLEVEEHGRKQRIWFSGDIGRPGLPLVRDPVLPEETDTLIMECTYGDRPHPQPEQAYEALRKVLQGTIARGGKVIIPAFAVGRTQELVYDLNQMIQAGELARVPVYVDSPLAVEASQIFHRHAQFFDEEAQEVMLSDEQRTALGFDLLTYVGSVEESRALNERDEPMVIISASGMLESGRVLHHLVHAIGNARNTILLVSYQAPHTLGRDLAEGQERVKVFGEVFERKAEVVQIAGFSAHAGRDFLVEYGLAAKGRAQRVFLVHGEQRAAEGLRENLEEGGMEKVYYPYLRQVMEI